MVIKKLGTLLGLGIFLLSQFNALAFTQDDVIGKPKVFGASEGKKITIIAVKPKASGRYLIYFESVGGDWDGKVILHNRTEGSNGEEYWVQISRKKKWTTFSSKTTWYSGWSTITVEPYNTGKAEDYFYDDKASDSIKKVDLDKILSLYKESAPK